MASPFASPFVTGAQPSVQSGLVSPFSPFAPGLPGADTGTEPETNDEFNAEDFDTSESDATHAYGNYNGGQSFNALVYAGPSTITANYPTQLPPRPSVDLGLTSGDVIVTDEVLGQGAWGDVCKGLYDGKDVAVKYVHWNGEPTELRSLQHELTVLARLKHPNILTMYGGSVKPEPEIFLVQELMVSSVSGVMYGKNGRPGRKLGLMEALKIGHDVIKGLVYLHQYNVVHRDIKPDNTLLAADGTAKIGDFGLARFKTSTVLQTRTLDMGTASYMAPELFDLELGGVTVAVDIYSYGITLWELIMGERPYKEYQREQAIMWQVLQKMRPHLPTPSADFPPQVMLLIQRCWAQSQLMRPTAVEVCAQLAAIIEEGATFDPNSPLIAKVTENTAFKVTTQPANGKLAVVKE